MVDTNCLLNNWAPVSDKHDLQWTQRSHDTESWLCTIFLWFLETGTYVSSSDGEPELKRQRVEFATAVSDGHTYSVVMSDDSSAVAAMQAINNGLGDMTHQITDAAGVSGHITIPVTITTESQLQVSAIVRRHL